LKTLERRVGLFSVIAISMGAMMGSGLFVLPGLATAITGPSVWIAYLIAGICVIPAALSKAELATAMPVSGGTYVYVDRTFGPLAGTIMGLGLWLSLLLKSSFALVGFAAYLYVLAEVPLRPVSLALLALIVVLNVLGIRKVGKVQVLMVSLSLIGLAVLVLWGSLTFQPHNMEGGFSGGAAGLLTAVSFVYISYAGVTQVAAIAEEVENPDRNLPLGITLSLVLITALYAATTLVLIGNVHESRLHEDLHPIYTMADAIAGPVGGVLAAVLGILTMTSMANAGVLSSSRFPFAMSRDRLLPGLLSRVHSAFMTPVACILLTGGVMAVAITFLDVTGIAKLASSLMIVAFMAECLTVIVLRESGVRWYAPTYTAPSYPALQIFGVVTGAALLWFMGPVGLVALVGMSVPGALLYLGYGRARVERRGVLGQVGPRRELEAETRRISSEMQAVTPLEAAVVVPLFGGERSPENLVEIAGALADGNKVQVVHVTDVPEQTAMGAMLEEDVKVVSLRRRVNATAEAESLDASFNAVVTRDVPRTVHDISSRLGCRWLVMQWRGRAQKNITSFNPLSWLVNRLTCNLAMFKDHGIRHLREILVLAEPGPHDALVVNTADHLATLLDGRLTFVRFVADSASEMTVQSEMDYVDELRALCSRDAEMVIQRGRDEVEALVDLTPAYDLLIMGAPPQPRLRDYIRGTPQYRLMRNAACSVLRLKTPPGRTHEGVDSTRPIRAKTGGEPRSLVDYIDLQCVGPRVELKDKDAAFTHFAKAFANVVPEPGQSRIHEAFWEREHSQNTSVGQSVAMPHATIRAAKRAFLGVFTSAHPIEYAAVDGEPVDVFFVTLGPPSERNTHLRILGDLSRLVLETPLLERLRAAETPEAIVEAFADCEQQAKPPR